MEVSTMTSKGQIVIPARLRKRYGLRPGTKIHFIERNHEILFQPVTKEYIRSLCGILKSDSSLTKELLKERARDKKREEEKLVKRGAR
jgi:AbrB family looped-hinge helix DNA binding protein